MCNDMDRKCSSSTSCGSWHPSRNSVGQLLALTWSQVNDNSHCEEKKTSKMHFVTERSQKRLFYVLKSSVRWYETFWNR
jgi:hypothetical protein